MDKRLGLLSMVLVAFLLIGCASKPTPSTGRSDPFEGFNRQMFNFNYYVLDPYVLRPVAVFWRGYVPMPARKTLSNFLSNLNEPASMINSFLSGDPYRGMKHFTRFFLNTTFGLGGLIDVASMANPEHLANLDSKEFGTTLAHYHVGYGPYLVLPGYGSFTIRDDGGHYVDYLYPALSLLTWPLSLGKWTLEGIETRANLLDSDGLIRNSPDPYIFMRETYFQHHDFKANDDKIPPKNMLDSSISKDELDEIDG